MIRQGKRKAKKSKAKRSSSISHRIWIGGGSAVFIAIIASVYYFNMLQVGNEYVLIRARLMEGSPGVLIRRKNTIISIEPGIPLLLNDMICTQQGGTAEIRYEADNTVVWLRSATEIILREEEGAKRISLTKGTIECDVDKQPPGKPMIISTPHAKAEVLSTRLILSAGAYGGTPLKATRVEVVDGSVRFTRISDHASIEVVGGFYAVAGEGFELVAVSVVGDPPHVDAGPDKTVEMDGLAMLSGSVNDDGLPDPPGNVTVTWKKISGHGAVRFSRSLSSKTPVRFSQPGTYVLQLTAYDGAHYASDDVTVTVSPESQEPKENRAPAVDAGHDREISASASAVLRGTVIDDGLPGKLHKLTVEWRQVSGPGTVMFRNASQPETVAGFSEGGTYVLELTAHDGEYFKRDEVVIIVNAPKVIRISFGPPRTPVPGGFLSDDGSLYSYERGMGWSRDLCKNTMFRPKGKDLLRRRHISPGSAEASDTWEIKLPQGVYLITVCCGDSQAESQGPHRVIAEGVTLIGDIMTNRDEYAEAVDVPVHVRDGRLTLEVGAVGTILKGPDGSSETNLCYIIIKRKE